MTEKRVFVSFDFDHDANLKGSFVSQASQHVPHLNIQDWSLPGPIDEGWKNVARALDSGALRYSAHRVSGCPNSVADPNNINKQQSV